jgi:hypothetical protein
MSLKSELIERLASHSIHESDEGYSRLRILSKKKAIDYKKNAGVKLLEKEDSFAVEIVEGGHLLALAIARPLIESSTIFNKKVGAVNWLTIDQSVSLDNRKNIIEKLLQKCHKNWRDLFDVLMILVEPDQCDILETIQETGAKVFGGTSTWVCSLDRLEENIFENASLEKVTFLEEKDAPELIECARQSYETYRSHYHADSRFDKNLCTDFFVSVIKKHVNNNGEVVVFKNEGEPISGFSTINPHYDVNGYVNSNLVGEAEIIGVSPFARGNKICELTLLRGIEWFKKNDFRYIILGCSISNYVVQSIWSRLGGFQPKRFSYQLHWWLG